MAMELRILSGARAGQRQQFDKSVVALGRHPMSDLQLDPERDLDVSTRHAEIRGVDGRYRILDNGSTNGTFVNGERVTGERELRDGDIVALGANGPQVEVRLAGRGTGDAGRAETASKPPATRMDTPRSAERVPLPASRVPGSASRVPSEPATGPRTTTAERVAVAVQEHTRGLRRMMIAAIVVLGVGVGLAYWLGHRESKRQLAELLAIVAENESSSTRLQTQLERVGAGGLAEAIRQQNAQLRSRVQENADSPQQIQALREEIRRSQIAQQGLAVMDLSTISVRNDSAVAFLVSELDGKPYGGTAFGVTTGGLLVTNRHNVRSDAGHPPSRLAVKFANTDRYLHAHVVKVSDDKDLDLALVQVDEPGTYHAVSGISTSMDAVRAGSPVVTIGFPHSTDLPMEGETVKTSLEAGTVSKRLDALLQIDSYAGHGSSGSPVFDVRGQVIGVVWGGAKESQGRIVYAVPGDKVAKFLPAGVKILTQ